MTEAPQCNTMTDDKRTIYNTDNDIMCFYIFVYCSFIICVLLPSFCCTVELLSLELIPELNKKNIIKTNKNDKNTTNLLKL